MTKSLSARLGHEAGTQRLSIAPSVAVLGELTRGEVLNTLALLLRHPLVSLEALNLL
jgi:hypothetical protein